MVTCNECGASNRADAQFCAQCDAYLAWVDQSSQKADTDTDPVRADAATRKPQAQPSRPATATPRRPTQEQPAVERRQPSRGEGASGADDTSPGRGVGAVRPAEVKPRIRKQYAAEPQRPRVGDLRSAAGAAGISGALNLPPGVSPTSLRGTLNEARVARGFGRQMRAAAGGRRVRYDRSLTARVVAVRSVLAIIGLLALVILVSPLRTTVKSWGDRQLDRVIPGRFQDLTVAAVSVEPPGGEEIRGFLPSYAIDGIPSRAWATRVAGQPGSAPGAECAGIRNQPTLVSQFEGPARVDRVTIQAGLDPESPDRLKQARPRVVDLLLSDNQCLRQELPDSFEPLSIVAPGTEVDSVALQIVDVYPAQSGAGDLVAISEITFSQR